MDYVVGSVAALISGNVTPNRPKRLKKPLTPMKHQPSPNVTPKSEFVNDRSIFLSPTTQKKKAIVKKSPKRIFQNPDLDVTNEDGESSFSSPKADKVKKQLEDKLDTDDMATQILLSPKSPKAKEKANKKLKNMNNDDISLDGTNKNKKNKKLSLTPSESEKIADESTISGNNDKENAKDLNNLQPKDKKKRKRSKAVQENKESEASENITETNKVTENETATKKKKIKSQNQFEELEVDVNQSQSPQKNKNKNKKSKTNNKQPLNQSSETENDVTNINPNAVTNKDTDSEHESDDEMHSENEEENKKTLDTSCVQESSDEEEPAVKKDVTKAIKEQPPSGDEVKRTIFVGNVPFSSKCKKELKKIFSTHGQIETVRIRTVPVKDATVTPKLAVIKKELHPDRTTVNVYIKFADVDSVHKALSENNTLLNGYHLRVSRSDTTGATHDPKCSVFVGNIPFALEDEGLRAKFEKCGEIESVRIVRDKKTNAGKGFGYVNFTSKDGVELALALTDEDLTFKNRIMRVKRCTQPTHKALSKQNTTRNREQTGHQGSVSQTGYQGRRDRQTVWNKDRGNQFGRGKFGHDSTDGAYRRIKRKHQDGAGGPPNKRQNLTQPKKDRKEFVGMTSEKRTKQKFNKGQKKKKILSEILTK